MQTLEPIDLSILPANAQNELYDFYLFLQQRYADNDVQIQSERQKKQEALKRFLENNQKRHIKVDPAIDLSALADEINDMEI